MKQPKAVEKMDKHLRTRKHTAESLIITGIILLCGSTGACENGAYSLLEYIFCSAYGVALVLVGKMIGRERKLSKERKKK